ncbi:MAG: hypothetical protein FJ387_14240 [Verrucomicrobia bacterium]|nr:hypothetical protein [Verrucomicrobiota bacterium]
MSRRCQWWRGFIRLRLLGLGPLLGLAALALGQTNDYNHFLRLTLELPSLSRELRVSLTGPVSPPGALLDDLASPARVSLSTESEAALAGGDPGARRAESSSVERRQRRRLVDSLYERRQADQFARRPTARGLLRLLIPARTPAPGSGVPAWAVPPHLRPSLEPTSEGSTHEAQGNLLAIEY